MDFLNEMGVNDEIDSTPMVVAALVLGSVAVLAALKLGGFRFTFSANLGAR